MDPWRAAAAALLIPGLLAANLWGFRAARQWRSARLQEKFLLQTSEMQPDEALAGLYRFPDQSGNPALAGRSLGLELNAFHYGVME